MLHPVALRRGRNSDPSVARGGGLVPDGPPSVIDGQVVRVIEINPYSNAHTALGGCTSFTGRYVVDPEEIAAIALRVNGVSR